MCPYKERQQQKISHHLIVDQVTKRMEIILKRSHNKVKKPHHVNKNIFALYPPRHINIEPATCSSIDTEIICILPGHSQGFITSTFRGDEIKSLMLKSNVCGLKY